MRRAKIMQGADDLAQGRETLAAYLDRIDGEISAGLDDLKSGNTVDSNDHRAEMDRFMSELRRARSDKQTP